MPSSRRSFEARVGLVAMRRFDRDRVLDRLAAAGGIDLPLVEALAEHVAAFHAAAERRPDRGGIAAMAFVVDTNDRALADAAPVLDRAATLALTAATRAALDAVGPLLERRRREGFVRLGHGDLHLGNICLLDGEPRLFDALEFDERLTCLDTVYDIAFLIDGHDFSASDKATILATLIEKCRNRGIDAQRSSMDEPEIKQRAEAEWDTLALEIGNLPPFKARFAAMRDLYTSLPW